jgi:hypothetical protein
MYALNHKINQVSSFKISNNFIVYKDIASLMDKKLFLNGNEIGKNITGFQCFENYIIYSNWSNKTYMYDIINKFSDEIRYEQISEYKLDKKLVFSINQELYIVDKFEELYILDSDILKYYNFLLDNLYFSTNENNTQIHAYTLPSATPLWQFDLGSLGEYVNISNEKCSYEVRFFLGIYVDCLLVQLSNATIICIDCNTGKQKYIVNLNESYPLPKPVFYDDSFKAHIVGEKLIFLNNQRLLHINLDSFEITIIQDYFTQERAFQYRFMHNTYFEDKIYFVADYGWQYVTPSYVGVMNANTGEVLWKQQLENTGGLSEAPQVNSDKLYIRTNNNVLHIFEKE